MSWFGLVVAVMLALWWVLGFWVGRRTGYNAGARWAAAETARRIEAQVMQRLGD